MADNSTRRFIRTTQAWYWESIRPREPKFVDEVMLQSCSQDGLLRAEFMVRWYDLKDGKLSPKLEMFDDSWKLLIEFDFLFRAMAAGYDSKNMTPDEFCELLGRCGFVDDTEREMPANYHSRPSSPA